MNRQRALYEYLSEVGDNWTSQVQVARDLYRYFGNAECFFRAKAISRYNRAFGTFTNNISDNFSSEYEKIVISSSKGIKLANEEEFDRYIKGQYKSAIRKLARVYAMAKKGNRHNQMDFGGHTFEAFLLFL